MTAVLVPVTPVVDLYGLASRLLGLVVDGFDSRGVSLPPLRYVAGGRLPAYDSAQVTVNIPTLSDGSAGGGVPPADNLWDTRQFAEATIAIVRDFPTEVPTPGPTMRGHDAAVRTNLSDVAVLYAVLVDIRAQQLLADDSTSFAIPSVITEGPEGGVVAAVGTVSIDMWQARSWS